MAYDSTPASPARRISNHIQGFHRNFVDSSLSGSAMVPYDTVLHRSKNSHHIRNSGLTSLGEVILCADQTICVVLKNNTPCAFRADVR